MDSDTIGVDGPEGSQPSAGSKRTETQRSSTATLPPKPKEKYQECHCLYCEDEEMESDSIGKEQIIHQAEVHEGLKLNIMESDSIEAVVLDLEELIARIEWLKGKLIQGVGDGEKSNWKYEDYLPSSSKGTEEELKT